jgi:hypothetical protein
MSCFLSMGGKIFAIVAPPACTVRHEALSGITFT